MGKHEWTFIEVMCVLVIVGMLIAFVGAVVVRYLPPPP